MFEGKPKIYVTNWSSRKLHGPGRKLTIMAAPRAWEHGAGRVPACTPLLGWLQSLRAGTMDLAGYRERIRLRLAEHALAPGPLVGVIEGDYRPVESGDTLLCACSREAAARGECHRVWVAEALAAAGWEVVLDGAWGIGTVRYVSPERVKLHDDIRRVLAVAQAVPAVPAVQPVPVLVPAVPVPDDSLDRELEHQQ
jgi:hypothetical protein